MATLARRHANSAEVDWAALVPNGLLPLDHVQTALPRLARDATAMARIQAAVARIPTRHQLWRGDARLMPEIAPESVHLVLTSPPYWTLKEYRPHAAQLGHIVRYDVSCAEPSSLRAQPAGRGRAPCLVFNRFGRV